MTDFVFPGGKLVAAEEDPDGNHPPTSVFWHGLTKRELFAAMAMQGLFANPYFTERAYDALDAPDNQVNLKVSELAVHTADRLIAELEKK